MARIQQSADEIEQQLADNTLYEEQGKERLRDLLQRKGELDTQLATAEEAWLSAAEALEGAQQGQ